MGKRELTKKKKKKKKHTGGLGPFVRCSFRAAPALAAPCAPLPGKGLRVPFPLPPSGSGAPGPRWPKGTRCRPVEKGENGRKTLGSASAREDIAIVD
jgi:hypothetical protein